MKLILYLGLAGLLALAATGCSTGGGGRAASSLAPTTVSGSVSVGASTHF